MVLLETPSAEASCACVSPRPSRLSRSSRPSTSPVDLIRSGAITRTERSCASASTSTNELALSANSRAIGRPSVSKSTTTPGHTSSEVPYRRSARVIERESRSRGRKSISFRLLEPPVEISRMQCLNNYTSRIMAEQRLWTIVESGHSCPAAGWLCIADCLRQSRCSLADGQECPSAADKNVRSPPLNGASTRREAASSESPAGVEGVRISNGLRPGWTSRESRTLGFHRAFRSYRS
jgi:hypothetical protein